MEFQCVSNDLLENVIAVCIQLAELKETKYS